MAPVIPFDTLRAEAQTYISQPIFVTISGAHLYGFPSSDSDFDLRGAHIGQIKDVFGLFPGRQTIETTTKPHGLEVEIVSHEISKYLRLLMKPNGYVLEQIYSPLEVLSTPAHQELKSLALGTICRGLYHHYRGFLYSLRKLIEKEPVRKVKRILYLYRVLLTGTHVLKTGILEANLNILNEHFRLSSIPRLIEFKQLEWALLPDDPQRYWDEIADLEAEMTRAFETSVLPESPSGLQELSEFLVQLRRDQIA